MILEHKLVVQKIGYITLPKFYHDFKNQGGRSSADDIKKDYQTEMKKFCEFYKFNCRKNKMDYVKISTNQNLDEAVANYLIKRNGFK